MKLESVLTFVALTLACGPGLPIGSDTSTDTTGSTESSTSASTSASTSSTSTTTGTETDSADGGESFIPAHDLSPPPSCEPFQQDCPDGEKCVPYASAGATWDDVKCVPVLGDQATGEPCMYTGIVESTDDCDAGNFCLNVQEGGDEMVGTCHAFCTGSIDRPQCPEDSHCAVSGDGVIALCIPFCDPLAPNCDEGTACYFNPSNNSFQCIFTTTDLPTGAACELINDCAGGNYCLAADWLPTCDGTSCCSPYCHLDLGDAPCAALPGTSCVSFFEDGTAPPGLDHVGLCVSPP